MSDETDGVPGAVEAAIARIEGMINSGFAQLGGRIDLVLQRADQTDTRLQELAGKVADHDQRIREQEVRAATRDDVKALDEKVDTDVTKLTGKINDAVTHTDLDQRFRRTTAIMTIVVAIVGIVVSSGVALLIALAL